jgi:hypothetical protein
MEIVHRIGFNGNEEIEKSLRELGVEFTISQLPGESYLLYLDISESDSKWPEVQKLIAEYEASDMPSTVFTQREILTAKWLILQPDHFSAYPFPESNWLSTIGYVGCSHCGVGWKQKHPFRIEKELKFPKYAFTSLFWAYPILVRSDVKNIIVNSAIQGCEFWPLIIAQSGKPSKVVQQLFVPSIARPSAIVQNLPVEKTKCDHTKYLPVKSGQLSVRGDFLVPDVDFQLTYEWFGSGTKAYREVLVSHKVARMIIRNGWKGVKLYPVKVI